MTIDEISKLAASGTKPDNADITLPERALWYALRDIYQAYRQGRADTEQCAKDKAVAVRQYELDTSDWVKAKEVWQSMAQFWKDAEAPSRAYAFSQNRTPEGDAMFEAFYKVPLKAQKEQWEKKPE